MPGCITAADNGTEDDGKQRPNSLTVNGGGGKYNINDIPTRESSYYYILRPRAQRTIRKNSDAMIVRCIVFFKTVKYYCLAIRNDTRLHRRAYKIFRKRGVF